MNSSSIFSFFKNLNLTKVLGGANKTLNFVKQAVPIYKDIKPTFLNAKKLINTYNEIKKPSIIPKLNTSRPLIKQSKLKDTTINDGLTFFQ